MREAIVRESGFDNDGDEESDGKVGDTTPAARGGVDSGENHWTETVLPCV